MIFRTHKSTRKVVFRAFGFAIFFGLFVFVTDLLFKSSAIPRLDGPESQLEYYREIVADNKVVALTFDDGPNPRTTLKIAEILKDNDVPATFFFLGTNVLKYPHIVRRIHADGFEIGNHTFSHSYDVHSSPSRLEFELNTTSNILKNVTGVSPIFYRPPYLLDIGGDTSLDLEDKNVPLTFASEMGYVVVGADVNSNDWQAESVDEVVTYLFEDLKNRKGHIVLLHDGYSGKHTVEALPQIISILRSEGYEFVSLSTILGLRGVDNFYDTSAFFGSFSSFFAHASYFAIYIFAESNSAFAFFITVTLWLFVLRFLLLGVLFIIRYIKRAKSPSIINRDTSQGVSIIIPAYNEASNIVATVTSVLDNSYKNIEIIIVDDGSTDNTAVISEWIQNKYPHKIRFISISNGGKARALNKGMLLAQNEIVVCMDGDTIFDRDAIRFLVQHFADPGVSGVAGKVCVSDTENVFGKFQEIEYAVAQNIDKEAFNVINAIGVIPGAVGAWRKSDILRLGGYSSDTLAEDQDLTLAVLASGKKVVYESRAISYTETPHSLGDFLKQRFRWLFGTIQCLWKYKAYMFDLTHPSLGFVILPNTLVYTILLALLYPVFDLLFISYLFLGSLEQVLFIYVFFTSVDMLYAGFAFAREKKRGVLLLLPFQRIFYRFIIYVVIVRCFVKMIEGSEAVWGKVARQGTVSVSARSAVWSFTKVIRW